MIIEDAKKMRAQVSNTTANNQSGASAHHPSGEETPRSARKDDRSVESLVEFIEGGKSQAGGREKKQKRKKRKASVAGNV